MKGFSIDLTKDQRSAIADRIKPYGMVCVVGESCGVTTISEAAAELPGKAKYVTCTACHGAGGEGGIGPTLQGRDTNYITGRLIAYRAGETVGAQSALMWGQASALSDTDISDLAAYVQSL